MYELTVDSHFSAAHYLKGYDGDCARMHGHTWKISVSVESETVDESGICIDFRDIASILDSIAAQFDHRCLNDLEVFNVINPTSENLAKIIFGWCREKIESDTVSVLSATVAESDRYRATYSERRKSAQ